MIRPLMFAVLVSLAGVAAAETLHGRVSEIIDGDTLRVELAQRLRGSMRRTGCRNMVKLRAPA